MLKKRFKYIAIGDSVASGFNLKYCFEMPDLQTKNVLPSSYPFYIYQNINDLNNKKIQKFSNFSLTGSKIEDWLNLLKTNEVKNKSFSDFLLLWDSDIQNPFKNRISKQFKNFVKNSGSLLKEEIKTADFITITLGANDFLANLIEYIFQFLVKKDTSSLIKLREKIIEIYEVNKKNLFDLINLIKKENNEITIFLVGYPLGFLNIFPLFNHFFLKKIKVEDFFFWINNSKKEIAKKMNLIYVEPDNKKWIRKRKKFSNFFLDLHPTEDGYKELALDFIKQNKDFFSINNIKKAKWFWKNKKRIYENIDNSYHLFSISRIVLYWIEAKLLMTKKIIQKFFLQIESYFIFKQEFKLFLSQNDFLFIFELVKQIIKTRILDKIFIEIQFIFENKKLDFFKFNKIKQLKILNSKIISVLLLNFNDLFILFKKINKKESKEFMNHLINFFLINKNNKLFKKIPLFLISKETNKFLKVLLKELCDLTNQIPNFDLHYFLKNIRQENFYELCLLLNSIIQTTDIEKLEEWFLLTFKTRRINNLNYNNIEIIVKEIFKYYWIFKKNNPLYNDRLNPFYKLINKIIAIILWLLYKKYINKNKFKKFLFHSYLPITIERKVFNFFCEKNPESKEIITQIFGNRKFIPFYKFNKIDKNDLVKIIYFSDKKVKGQEIFYREIFIQNLKK
ncbi:SGNH/GDSL hydrolase family protein [Mycoplasma sp. 480]|uniref:SGNH/GDSL hydrolase family protein n=1 Tax=Mycoplasma sp. 480 TaxID=3440155 RepID=UPI003F51A0C6